MSHAYRTKSFCRTSAGRLNFRPRFEPLESRQMLSISLNPDFGEFVEYPDGVELAEGLVTTDFTGGGNEEARAIEMDGVGNLVVAGVAGAIRVNDAPDVGGGRGGAKGGGSDMGEPDEPLVPDFALARYDAFGTLDPAFGDLVDPLLTTQTGKTMTDFGTPEAPTYDEANGMLLLDDGRILLVGSTRAALDGPADFALACYTSDGVLDPNFGPDGTGLVTTDLGGDDVAKRVAIQGDQLIVIGSTVDPDGSTSNDFAVVRYDTNGNVDNTFNENTGVQIVDFYGGKDEAVDVLIVEGNKIVVVGHIKDDSRVEPKVFGGPLDHGLIRLTEDGLLDTDASTGFGFDVVNPLDETEVLRKTGMVSYDLGMYLMPGTETYSTDEAWAAALQGDNIVVAGRYGAKGVSDFSVVRYTPDGMLDTSFGVNGTGIRTTDINAGPDACYDVAIMENGDIIVPGRYTENDKFAFAMVRYDPNAIEAGEEWTTEHFVDGPDQASVVAITGPNSVVIAGWASMPGTMVDFGLAGLTVSGEGSASQGAVTTELPTLRGGKGGRGSAKAEAGLTVDNAAAILAVDLIHSEVEEVIAPNPRGWRTSPGNLPVERCGFSGAPFGPWSGPHIMPKPWENRTPFSNQDDAHAGWPGAPWGPWHNPHRSFNSGDAEAPGNQDAPASQTLRLRQLAIDAAFRA